VVKKDYGPAGIRFELADLGVMPLWNENNDCYFAVAAQRTPSFIMDREIPRLEARLEEWNKLGSPLSNDQKNEFVQVSSELELLKHQRELILSRVGDEYVVPPPAP